MAIPALASSRPWSQAGAFTNFPASHSSGYSPKSQTLPSLSCAKKAIRLRQPAVFVVHIPDNDRTHAVDDLGQVGDDGHQAARHGLPVVLDGGPRIDEPRSGLQGEPFVVDTDRTTVEALRVECLELLVLRQHDATRQPDAYESDKQAKRQPRPNDPGRHAGALPWEEDFSNSERRGQSVLDLVTP